jgi:hypothetical protein
MWWPTEIKAHGTVDVKKFQLFQNSELLKLKDI